MEDFMAFMNQTGVPVLIVMGSLLLLFLMIAVYAALVVSGRADEQSERAWAAWCQSHPDPGDSTERSGV